MQKRNRENQIMGVKCRCKTERVQNLVRRVQMQN